MTSERNWWTTDEVAAELRMRPEQVRVCARDHGLPYRDFGGVRRYPSDLVLKWAAEGIEVRRREPAATVSVRVKKGRRVARAAVGAPGARPLAVAI